MNRKNLLLLAIISSLLFLLLPFISWKLVEIFTSLLMPFVWMAVIGIFLVVFVISIIVLFKKRDLKPFVLQCIALLLLFLIPFNQIVIDLNFKMYKTNRIEVVEKIQDGTLQPNVSYNASLIRLPKEYDHLSSGGGEIIVEKHGETYSVLFFTYRGVLDNFSGFVYSPDDVEPNLDTFGGDFKEIEKIDEHWYFVASS